MIPPAFRGAMERDAGPELLILDVDGVLTNNIILLDGDGGEWKPFYVPDGTGIHLLQIVGVKVALVSGRLSAVVHRRAKELGIDWHLSGVRDKSKAVRDILNQAGASREHAVYVGDDLIDIPAMREVDLPVAVANAPEEVRRESVAVTRAQGGQGAVREVCEWILAARGEWARVLEKVTRPDPES
ncbi:MAG: HAD hydrolase family protein [Planctomycetota bacterium]